MSVITTTYEGDMLFKSQVGEHTVTIDVPSSMGGHDRGVMPPQLFIVSIGACIAALITEYCNKHDIDATGLAVDVAYNKAAKPSRLENICATVRLPNADVKNKERALQHVAHHCPVHETIMSMSAVEITIEDRSSLAEPML